MTETHTTGTRPARPAVVPRTRSRLLPPLLGVVALLVVWQTATWLFAVPAWMLPSPSRIVVEAVAVAPDLGDDLLATTWLTVLGFAIGAVLGLLVAALLHLVDPLKQAVYPLLIVSQNVPTIALAPLLVIWFGFGLTPKIVVIVLVCFFPVAVAAMDGLRAADPVALDYLRMSGADRGQVFRLLEVPGSLPTVFSGLKIAATYAVMGAVVAEWVGSDRGLGHYMLLQKSAFRADRMFVSIAVIIALSLLLFGLIALLERRLTRWRPRRER
ncbi:ABC transporter permease [Cellulomonas soli]|uniref:Nitrate ABC transporter permease n=1 Tax=Cellulomonas soli TaxID=931535 RepID=A0A512PB53_9CELL|nr:ABC transporter permease [Cellulomonas soli]NYI57280.1 ABC-type nitrate/sulfonate/bicarbonate transport system permease component [Cellulomonas soli]GEP68440.1 nitrate ABC transporter permease [Cellulomonas soli]